MKHSKLFIIPLLLILAAFLVNAENFDFTAEEVDIDILPGQTAMYDITIYNRNIIDDRFQLTGDISTTLSWDVSTSPQIVNIEAGTHKTIRLELTPHLDMSLGAKQVIMKLKSLETGELYRAAVPVYIGEGVRFGTYVPNVAITVDIDKEIDPREKVAVNVCLKNRNLLDIENLLVFVDGEVFEEEYESSIGPLEYKCNEILFTINNNETPQEHTLTTTVTRDNDTLASAVQTYEIRAYADIIEKSNTKTGLFIYTETITLYNDGNMEEITTIKREIGGFNKLFARSNPKHESLKEDGVSYVAWKITLDSEETKTITFVRDYRWPMIVLIVIVVAVVLYFLFRSPIVLFKDAYVIGKADEGVSDLKVKVLVKNRTRRLIKNIRIIDKIPSIAEVVEKEHLGTIKPSKIIKHGKKGTIIKWDIEGFEPYEERILSYKIKSTLRIVGGMSLPSVKARFEDNGKERTTTSNPVSLHKKE